VNLILLEPDAIVDRHVTLSGAQARHLIEVLRVTSGQDVRIGVIDGAKGVGRITAMLHGSVTLECRLDPEPPPRPDIDLLLALPRPKVMRRLWAQLAALGVGRIVLTNASRVERNYFDAHVLESACYRPLLIEGLQQAQDTRLPEVSVHRRFKVLIEDLLDTLCPGADRFVAHPSAGSAAVAGAWTGTRRALLAVGPEGGWDDYEMRLLEAHGFRPVSLGPRTLRTDTACVALLTALRSRR